jgi:predicted ATPase
MTRALERHDVILRDAIDKAEGALVKSTGDGLMAVFGSAAAAIRAALETQRELLAELWPEMCSIRVRMGVHSGEAEARGGDYFGPAVNRAARVMAAGHGGQVLLSAATAALVTDRLPPETALRDLGEHRLKDLERPERLFQLVHAGLSEDFPPLRTLDLRPNNLPTQASAFVGREAELRAVRQRIDDPQVRLLTLTGPGGTGKTRLALRAAAEQIDRFADGVFFVDLAGARNNDAVVALIGAAVGLTETRERSPIDDLKRQMRPQEVLLVLDNFEQVTIAAPTLVELLEECPGLKVLVTSREALHVRGENLLPVPPLTLPAGEGRRSVEDLSQFEAIQLFVERARAVRPEFNLTDDNAAAVADICRRLDGLPLAIELATARLNLFSPEALRDRLRSRLKVLAGGARDLPARQQTLRATIEWSYQLLEPVEQRLFELLSIFSGATLEAVEAVVDGLIPSAVGGLDAVDGVSSLLDKSLISQVETRDGGARFVMLETIHEYAAERLDDAPDFAEAARESHADYFARFAAEEWTAISVGDGERPLDTLASELENLRTAWRHWVSHGDLDRLNQVVDGLWQLYEARGWYHATIELANDLLSVLATTPPTPERWQQEVTLRTSLARAQTLLRGYTGEIEDTYAEALALFEGHREVPQLFPVLRSLASFHGFRGEVDKGVEIGQEILRLADAQGDSSMRVDGEVLVGANTAFAGDLAGGLAHLDQAIAAFEKDGYRPRRLRLGNDPRVSCLTTSGFILWMQGYPDRAVERADRAIALASAIDHPYSHAYALYHSGFLHLWRREPARVRDRALALRQIVESNDFPIWRALGLCLLGAATSSLGDPPTGVAEIEEGLDQYQGLRTPPVFWPMVRSMQAGVYGEVGRPEAGLMSIEESLQIAGQEALLAPFFHIVRGDLLRLLPEPDEVGATESYTKAFDVAASIGARSLELRAALRLWRVSAAAVPTRRKSRLAVVRELYETFDDGLSTPDLVDAAQVLQGA